MSEYLVSESAFYLPPEWHPHLRCWMGWPCRAELWGERWAAAQEAIAAVARAIAHFEPVTLIVAPAQRQQAEQLCSQQPTPFDIDYYQLELDDPWLRDTMPMFLVDHQGRSRLLNWDFNGWGERVQSYEQNRMLGRHLLATLKTHGRRFDGEVHSMVVEGSSILADGEGTLLAVRDSLLNPNRNRFWLPERIEYELKHKLGIQQIIWLEQGLAGVGQLDGHIDNLLSFIEPGKILLMKTSDPEDPNFGIYQQARQVLSTAVDAKGRAFELIEVEQPQAQYYQGQRLALSYTNFYRANNAIVMPAFDDPPRDQAAYQLFCEFFPRMAITQVPVLDIALSGGGIHDISMQQPLGQFAPESLLAGLV